MRQSKRMTANERNLIRRYLVWCYKTTKEDLDRIDRYFTQSVVDKVILKELQSDKQFKLSSAYRKQVSDFEKYMDKKLNAAVIQKFESSAKKLIKPDYAYQERRLKGIEKAITKILGAKELRSIVDLYEKEMTQRILSAREHT